MMRIVFHVGMPKAGSTSIQLALAQNSKMLLREAGLFYRPYGDYFKNHLRLFTLAMAEDLASLKENIAADVELAERNGADIIVFSIERAFALPGHPAAFSCLLRALRESGVSSIEFILVLRDLEGWLRSYIVQLVCNGRLQLDDLRLGAWTINNIRAYWCLPEVVKTIALPKSATGERLTGAFVRAASGQDLPVSDVVINVTPDQPLSLQGIAGMICQLRALSSGKDVNSAAMNDIRDGLYARFESLAGGHEAVASAFGEFGSLMEEAVGEYIGACLANVPERDFAIYNALACKPSSSNRSDDASDWLCK